MLTAPASNAAGARRLQAPPLSGLGALGGNLSQMLGSQAILGIVGLTSLPLLTRNVGPGAYGGFTMFVALLGVVANLDVARPLLVREISRRPGHAARSHGALALGNGLALAAFGAAVGLFLLDLATTCALVIALALHALASRSFATLSGHGRIGRATAIRNLAWAGATVAAVALSFVPPAVPHLPWCFAAANLFIFVVYRAWCGPLPAHGARRTGGATWKRYRAQILDLLGFGIAVAIVVAGDRALLRRTASPEAFGAYGAQYDLAIKINLLSTTLSSALYPIWSRAVASEGPAASARRFVRASAVIAAGYLVLLAGLIVAQRPLLEAVLGQEFLGGAPVYGLLLVGVFVHLFGFLITPWQRACGDFRTPRRAYAAAAVVMLLVGSLAIPTLGALGAACSYLAARCAELSLIAVEVRRLPRHALPRFGVACLGLAIVLLVCIAVLMIRAGS